jgi:hypothetical protein
MAQTVEPVDAVIISGARRGEIIRLPEREADVSEEDLRKLNQVLDELIGAIDRVTAEVRATTAMFRAE